MCHVKVLVKQLTILYIVVHTKVKHTVIGNDTDRQIAAGLANKTRFHDREDMITKQEDGQAQDFDSTVPGYC